MTGVVTGTPRIPSTASRAKPAVVHIVVSQPTKLIQLTIVGPQLPRTPKTAREAVRPGAPLRLPVVDSQPTRAKEPHEPAIVTSSACARSRP